MSGHTCPMDKRERWFSEGAPLFRQLLVRNGLADRLPTDDLYYLCPCCLYVFPFESVAAQILTIEHVPPKALGGKEMLLTCKRCNNDAGRDFDSPRAEAVRVSQDVGGRRHKTAHARHHRSRRNPNQGGRRKTRGMVGSCKACPSKTTRIFLTLT
ncbi:HNH endonuclease [Streptomyces sp. R08]|uniref:HNH endonuclease n=1 Tax=Streptomyces sp. R08 TaxID=3238624 RepID=A0AB39M9U9_9ACTN